MYVVLIRNTVKAGCEAEYAEVSKRFGQEMKRLPGLRDFLVLRSQTNEHEISDLLVWESREAAQADDGSVFLRFKPELKPLFEGNVTETFQVL